MLDKLRKVDSNLRSRLVFKMTECAYAPDYNAFCDKWESLVTEGRDRVLEFLKDVPLENWCNAFFMGQRYGEMCSSVVETWNKMIDEARHMSITSMIDNIRVQTMKSRTNIRNQCKTWKNALCA